MLRSKSNAQLISILVFFSLASDPITAFSSYQIIFSPKRSGIQDSTKLKESAINRPAPNDSFFKSPEDNSRRHYFLMFFHSVPFVAVSKANAEVVEDALAEFGKSLKTQSSSSGYPYSPSPLPSKFSSALDLTKKPKEKISTETDRSPESKTLDEVINDAKKSKKKQIGPLSHGY